MLQEQLAQSFFSASTNPSHPATPRRIAPPQLTRSLPLAGVGSSGKQESFPRAALHFTKNPRHSSRRLLLLHYLQPVCVTPCTCRRAAGHTRYIAEVHYSWCSWTVVCLNCRRILYLVFHPPCLDLVAHLTFAAPFAWLQPDSLHSDSAVSWAACPSFSTARVCASHRS